MSNPAKNQQSQTSTDDDSISHRRKKALNSRIIALGNDQTIFIKILGNIFERTLKNKVANVVKCVLLESIPAHGDYDAVEAGEVVQLILPAVASSTLENDEESIIGRSFEIVKKAKQAGNQYYTCEVYELE